MRAIPQTPESRLEILRNFEDTQNAYTMRRDRIAELAHDSEDKSLTEKKKDLLAKISVPLHISADFLFDDKVSKDKQNALVRIILNKKNGLNPDQQDVLLASLNGVQKALESFADTVVTVFGVKTEQAA